MPSKASAGMATMFAAALALALLSTSYEARAQDQAAKPLRIVVPFAPAGYPDRLGRVIAKHLSDSL